MAAHAMGHRFGQPGPAVLAVSSPSSWCTPSLLAGRAGQEAEEILLCTSTALHQLKYQLAPLL